MPQRETQVKTLPLLALETVNERVYRTEQKVTELSKILGTYPQLAGLQSRIEGKRVLLKNATAVKGITQFWTPYGYAGGLYQLNGSLDFGNWTTQSTKIVLTIPPLLPISSDGRTIYLNNWGYSLPQEQWRIYTVAGMAGVTGIANSVPLSSTFNNPTGITGVETVNGFINLYIADTTNNTIRKLVPDVAVGTLTGNLIAGSADGNTATARFNSPKGITYNAFNNTLVVADTGNHTIRIISLTTGITSTIAGLAGSSGTTNGTGAAARFNAPEGVGVDNLGNIYVADTGNHAIRKITPAGVVTTFAGLAGTSGSADGAAGTARFKSPVGIMVDSSGNLGVADTGNHIIRALNSVGFTFTVAGTAGVSGSLNGVRGDASFNSPRGIYLEGSSYIIVDSSNHSIRKIYSDGTVLTVAGLSGTSGTADGLGDAARFNNPTSICSVASRFYIADRDNQLIRGVEVKLFPGLNDNGDTDGQPDDNNGGPTGKGSKCSWKYIYFNYTNNLNLVSRTWFATSVTTGNQPNPPPATPVPLGIFAPVGTYANTSPPFPLSPSGYANLNRTSGNGTPGNWVQSSTAAGAIAIYNFDAAILANLQGLPNFVVFTINVTVNSVVQPSFKLWLPLETLGDFSVDLWPYLYTVPQVSNASNGFDSTILITLTSYDLAYRKDTCTAN